MNIGSRARSTIAATAAAIGLAVGVGGIAAAATSGSSSTTATAAAAAAAPTTQPDPATMSHGPGETLLTGTTAAKVRAAALAAVPGGSIIRVETDSGGSAYEAHMRKADGSTATVKLDAGFKVSATQSGFGGGPGGQAPPAGQAPGA